MFNALTELFFRTNFLFDTVAGRLFGDERRLFDCLYDAFMLPQEDRERLFSLCLREEVKGVETYNDYAQMCRIRQYLDLVGGARDLPDDAGEVIAVKGAALQRAKQLGYLEQTDGTETAVCGFIADTANAGLIPSLCILGMLQCEGVFVEKNVKLGIKNLEKAARWNSVEGMLLSMRYEESTRPLNLARLSTVVKGTHDEVIATLVRERYGLAAARASVVSENRLLQQAFGMRILKPDCYQPQYARFIFSRLLSVRDKERALFSGHNEVIAETAELPLKLKYGDIGFEERCLESLALEKEEERGALCRYARDLERRGDDSYRPICVCSDSEYIRKSCMDAFECALGGGANVEIIDVAALNDYDFEPSKNNVFVHSCNEDAQNVYFLYCAGDISETALTAVKNFLQSGKRRRFGLRHPDVSIDLSAILPICFCDRRNAQLLKPYCETVSLSQLSAAKKMTIICGVLSEKARGYGISEYSIDGKAKSLLGELSLDRAVRVIERVARLNRGATSLTVTENTLRDALGAEETPQSKFGFGGVCNEVQ